jgi:hypothetical protein
MPDFNPAKIANPLAPRFSSSCGQRVQIMSTRTGMSTLPEGRSFRHPTKPSLPRGERE